MHNIISSLSRADPPGSGFNNTNFSLLLCPENPENTANGSGKILESDSAQLRQFERVTIIVSGTYTNVGSNRPPSRPPLAFPLVAPRNRPRCGDYSSGEIDSQTCLFALWLSIFTAR